MKYQIFNTSEKAWVGMLAQIANAQQNVFLEMYILEDDAKGGEFFAVLEEAVKRGVRVVLILDVVGSFNPFGSSVGRLRELGAEVLYASFFFQRMHRKVLIVDESVAFVGGVNVGKKYARWKDLQIRVTGKHIIEPMLRSFVRVYKKCGGKQTLVPAKPHRGILKSTKLWFVDHGIGKRQEVFKTYYEGRLDKAKKSIVLVTPYLFPPRWFIASIHQAVLRGVRVEILLPETTDYKTVDSMNRTYATSLVSIGAKVYFTKGMNHGKAMVVDDAEGIIGSQNLDLFSFHMNIEAGVFFHDVDMIRDLNTIIETWKKDAEPFDPRTKGFFFNWYDMPMAFTLRLFGFLPLD